MIEFDSATHTYTVDGKIMPSVSDIIAPLSDFSDISPATLEYAAARGTAVHSACEQLDYGIDIEDIEELDPETAPYVQAYIAWKRDFQVEVLHSEYKVYSDFYEVCGTLDRVVEFGSDHTPWIVDLKTTATFNYSNALKWHQQLWLYDELLSEQEGKEVGTFRFAILQLKKDGSYRFVNDCDLFDAIRKKYPGYSPYGTMHNLLEIYNTKKGRTV